MTHFRKLSIFLSSFAVLIAAPVRAAAPDLTTGGVPTDNDQWNLGPTGMAGWCYREGISSANARQFLVRSVAAGSPAAGIMAVNDVILGASGTGADSGELHPGCADCLCPSHHRCRGAEARPPSRSCVGARVSPPSCRSRLRPWAPTAPRHPTTARSRQPSWKKAFST